MTLTARYASPIDPFVHGSWRPRRRGPAFTGRLGSAEFPAVAGRYHVYGSWSSPATHRLAILRELHGLAGTISLSYVHGLRDGRGWAFREPTGPDPLNGFTLLREAYEASRPGYDGEVSVPTLWDAESRRVVSTDAVRVGVDLATAFGRGPDTYPAQDAAEIERFGAWLGLELDAVAAVYDDRRAPALRQALRELDDRLAARTHLLGERLTDADVRLWVELVRLDAGPNAHGALGPRLDAYPALWRWACALYARPAFRTTTDFAAFSAPFADLPPWPW